MKYESRAAHSSPLRIRGCLTPARFRSLRSNGHPRTTLPSFRQLCLLATRRSTRRSTGGMRKAKGGFPGRESISFPFIDCGRLNGALMSELPWLSNSRSGVSSRLNPGPNYWRPTPSRAVTSGSLSCRSQRQHLIWRPKSGAACDGGRQRLRDYRRSIKHAAKWYGHA